MREPTLRRLLASGEATVGSWVTLATPEVSELMAAVGFDWLVVDGLFRFRLGIQIGKIDHFERLVIGIGLSDVNSKKVFSETFPRVWIVR